MTLAIRWGGGPSDPNGGFIYLDAVSVFTQNFSGQTTKHPIDSAGSIVDHYVSDNPVFTVSGVVSGVDIGEGLEYITDLNGFFPFNTNLPPNNVSVLSTDSSVLDRFIPDSIGQFLPDQAPEIEMDEARPYLLDVIRDSLVSITSGVIFNQQTGQFDSNIQLVNLYEYTGTLINRVIDKLVITRVTFNENESTGVGLYCDITFERVTFAFLKKTELPKDVQRPVQKKASPKRSIGKCDSTVKDANSATNADPQGKKDSVNNSVNDIDPRRNL